MTQWIDPQAETLIRSWEKEVRKVYLDGGGVKTAGVGHTGADVNRLKVGAAITKAQSDAWFRADVLEAAAAVDKYVKVPLTPKQRGVLTSFTFNVGVGAFAGSTLVKVLNAGHYSQVPAQLARWTHDGGKVVRGLVNRRNAEIALWLTGAAPKVALADIPDGIPAGSLADKPTKTKVALSPEVLTAATAVGTAAAPAMFSGNPISIAVAIGGLLIVGVVAVLLYKRLHAEGE